MRQPKAPEPVEAPRAARGAEPRGIQTIEVGGRLLLALAHHGQPLALQMGLIGLQQYDPVRLATPLIDELARATGHTVAIAVWGHRGPTLVRIAEAPSPVHVSMRHGTVMSIPGTASGRLFAAYGPPDAVAEALANEARLEAKAARPRGGRFGLGTAFDAEVERVRRDGVACVEGIAVPGVSAVAAPVFDARGRLVLSLTAIGPSAIFDATPGGAVAGALKPAAQALSARLGWQA